MSTRTIRTHAPAPAAFRPATRPYRAAKPRADKRDSPLIPLITVLAVAGAVTVLFIAGYHFVLPLLSILDGN